MGLLQLEGADCDLPYHCCRSTTQTQISHGLT